MTTHLPPFAQWLNSAMAARNFSQADLARKLAVNDSQVSRWRRGAVTPGLGHLERLADLFGMPRQVLEDLVGHAASRPADSKQETTDPVIAAEIEAGARVFAEVLKDVPRPMWSAYIKACQAMGETMRDAFSSAPEPPVSRGEPENDAGDEPRRGGPRNRALPGRQHALAAR